MCCFKQFLKDEDGVGVVEIILILVVLIGLVIIFKNQNYKLKKKVSSIDKTYKYTFTPLTLYHKFPCHVKHFVKYL